MKLNVVLFLLIIGCIFSINTFSQERKIEKRVYSNFRQGKLDVALTELDNLYDKYNMKSFFYYWKAYIYMAKVSELKKIDNTNINRDSASYYIEKSLSFLSNAPLFLTSEDLNLDKLEFDILFPGCNVNPPVDEKKYTNCMNLIKNDFTLKKEAINELKYNLLLSEKIEEYKNSNKDISSFLKEIKPRVKSVPALNPLYGEVSISTYMELANIRNQKELMHLQKDTIDENWLYYIENNTDEEYLSIVPDLEKMINNLYFKNLENQYQKIKNNIVELKIYLANLEQSKKLLESNPAKYIAYKLLLESNFSSSFIEFRKENYSKIINVATIKLKELIEIQEKIEREEKIERQKKFEEGFDYQEKFEDNFDKNSNGWNEIENDKEINKIVNGKFIIENKYDEVLFFVPVESKIDPFWNRAEIFIDRISIDVKWINGNQDNFYEILWGANTQGDHLSFGINAAGSYRFMSRKNGTNNIIISSMVSEHINKKGSNILSVKVNQRKLEFYINYFKVNECELINGFVDHQIGFLVNGAQRVEFDDLKVAFTETGLGGDESEVDSDGFTEEERNAIELGKIRWEEAIELSRQSENEEKSHNDGYGPVIKDINGNKYKTVYIGTQHWMAENLKVNKYNDGTSIPNITDKTKWGNNTTGAWCNYNNDASKNTKYGKLYNWHAVSGRKNVCPTGWHVPSDAEWTDLIDYLGGESVAGDKMREVGTTNWNSPNTYATNMSLYTGLPGGYRDGSGNYSDFGYYGNWWSSTENKTDDAWVRGLANADGQAYREYDSYKGVSIKKRGLSVRCLRD